MRSRAIMGNRMTRIWRLALASANLYPLCTSQTGVRNGSFAYDLRTRTIATPEVE